MTEVCTNSTCPTITMVWIKEVEMAKSVDDLKTSQSIERHEFSVFEMLDAKTASALKKIISNHHFRRRVRVEEQRVQEHRVFRDSQLSSSHKCKPAPLPCEIVTANLCLSPRTRGLQVYVQSASHYVSTVTSTRSDVSISNATAERTEQEVTLSSNLMYPCSLHNVSLQPRGGQDETNELQQNMFSIHM